MKKIYFKRQTKQNEVKFQEIIRLDIRNVKIIGEK